MIAPPRPWMSPEGHDPRLGCPPGGRQAAHGRGPGEDDDAEHHHLLVTDRVGQPAPEGEERGQRQQIGVDRPLHARAREPELSLDLGRRDGDDRLVDERHRDGEDHRRQDEVSRSTDALRWSLP